MERKILIFGIFFVLVFAGAFASDVNIFNISSPSSGTYWKNGSHDITFTVFAEDVNGSEGQADLNVEVYYSDSAGAFSTLIGDYNLINTSYCGRVNDFSTPDGVQCTIPWPMSIGTDGNYYIDLNAYAYRNGVLTGDFNKKSSDSFYVDNTAPTIELVQPVPQSQTTSQKIVFDVNDDGSGVSLASIEVQINNGSSDFNTESCEKRGDGNYHCTYWEWKLDATGNYNITIEANDTAENSHEIIKLFSYLDEVGPSKVLSVTCPSGEWGDRSIKLYWGKNTERDIYKYYIYRSTTYPVGTTDGNRKKVVLHSNACNGQCTAIDSNTEGGFSNNTPYYYAISAVDKSGNEGPASDINLQCTPQATTISGIPTISSSTHEEDKWVNNDDPKFTWNSVTGGTITYYYALNQQENYTPTTSDSNTASTSKEYSDKENGIYWFHVRAYNGTNWSNADHYKIKIDDLNPNKPGNFSLSLQSNGDIKVSWSKPSDNGPSGIDKYYIVRAFEGDSLDKSHYDERFEVGDPGIENYIDESVSTGNTYCYRMYAVDFAGNESDLTDKLCKKSKKEEVNISINVPEYAKAEEVEIVISSSNGDMKGCILKLKKATEDHFRSVGSYFTNTSSITRYYPFSEEDHGIAEFKVECDNGEKTKSIRVDTGIPDISWVKPSDGETIKGKIELQVEARDIGYGLKEIIFYYNGTEISKTSSAFEDNKYRVYWDTKSIQPGKYTLKAKAVDKAGNSKEEEISVSVEKEEEPMKKKAEKTISLAEESKAKAEKTIESFNEKNIPLPESLALLKKQAGSLLISSKSYFSKDDFENAENNAKKAMEKYETIAGYSIEEFFKKEVSFKEKEINALIESMVFDKEISKEAIANLEDANARKKIRVFKVIDANKEEYIVAIEISFENKSNDTTLQIVEFIPKELAKSSDEISSLQEFEVLVSDPVIKFTLKDIEQGSTVTINYYLKKALSKKEFDDFNKSGAFNKFNTIPLVFKSTTLLKTAAFTSEKTGEQIQPIAFFSLTNLLPWIGITVIAIIVLFVVYLYLGGRAIEPEPTSALGQAIKRTHTIKKLGFFEGLGREKKKPVKRRWKYEGA